MKRMLVMTLCLLVVCALFVASCSLERDNPMARMNLENATIAIYSDGQWSEAHEVAVHPAVVKEARQLLVSMDDQWQSSMVSYAPYIVIRTDEGSINIQKNLIVANARDEDGSLVQRVRLLTESEYEQLRKLVDQFGIDPKK